MSIRASVERVVAAVEAREDELVEAMLERNVAEVPDLGLARDEPAVLEAYRASACANLRAALAMLSGSNATLPDIAGLATPSPPIDLPLEAVREARASVRARVPLEALLRTYRIGHAVTWEALIDEVERAVSASPDRQAVLRLLNRHAFAYMDAVLPTVAREYESEGRRLSRQFDQRRFDAVMAIIDGLASDATALNYEIRGWHIGLITWGGSAPEGAVTAIASRLERPALCVRAAAGTAWGWIRGRANFGPETWQLVRSTRLPDGTCAALGSGLNGLEGFRRTHRQARDAQRIGMALGNEVTRYSDVAVEALAMRDPDAVGIFVDEMLSPLTQGRNADTLRRTLAAYLQCGLNASAAAKSLGVNDRTVAYRLKLIEGLTGHSLTEKRFELEAAMRLNRVLRGMH